jgi:SAM-dependent methyltransferase
MGDKYLTRNVSAERRRHYGGEALRADDLRRNLILNYADPPSWIRRYDAELGRPQPKNLWLTGALDIINGFDDTEGIIGADMGTSSGYLPRLLLENGYRGGILACDAETTHLGNVTQEFSANFPDANIWFGKANAESMKAVEVYRGNKLRIKPNTFDWTTQYNIHHHTGDALRAINTAVRITRDGGYIGFMDRAVGHLDNMYKIGEIVADEFNAEAPEPWYSHFDFYDLEKAIDNNPSLIIVKKIPQAEYIWVPDTDEGWRDYITPFYTLVPLMRSKASGERFEPKQVEDFVESTIRHEYFKTHASYENGYFTDYIFQEYILCNVVKK